MSSILFLGLLLSPLVVANHHNKPILQELTIPRNLAENRPLKLNCATIQGESVEFVWYLNDEKLVSNSKRKITLHDETSELVIKSLSIDDLGEIKCVAKNKFGEDVQKVSLNFLVKPRLVKEPEDVMSTLSKEVSLQCDAKGYPSPVVQWYKLADDKQTVIKEFEQSGKLNFELSKESAGFYKCKSSNQIGSVEKIISVAYFGE